MDITLLCFFHIIVINTLFILVDYLVLSRITKSNVAFVFVAVAGLTSLFLSVYLTNRIINYHFNEQWFGFQNGIVRKQIFIIGAAIFTLLTIMIEFAFYSILTRQIKRSLKSSLIANLATNVPIGLFYLMGDMYYSHND